jgi:predicted GNAT superfamily acetyltransferase
MTDEINAGDDSDRLFVYWDLSGAKRDEATSPDAVAIKIPDDIEALRRTNLEEAKLWRSKTRETIEPLMNQGWTIKRMQDRTHLLIEPPK